MAEERPQRVQRLGKTQASQIREGLFYNPQDPKVVIQDTIALMAEINRMQRAQSDSDAQTQALLQEIVNELRIARGDIPKYT